METMTEADDDELYPSPVTDLIAALEQATIMAKQLPSSLSDSTRTARIHSALHSAHHSLSLYLSRSSLHPHPPLRPSLAADPMEDDDDEIEAVEERMREVFIQSKRTKRRLSPETAAAVEEEHVRRRGTAEEEGGGRKGELDPVGRGLDLVFQFHG